MRNTHIKTTFRTTKILFHLFHGMFYFGQFISANVSFINNNLITFKLFQPRIVFHSSLKQKKVMLGMSVFYNMKVNCVNTDRKAPYNYCKSIGLVCYIPSLLKTYASFVWGTESKLRCFYGAFFVGHPHFFYAEQKLWHFCLRSRFM